MITAPSLRSVPEFADLDDASVAWLIERMEDSELDVGDLLFDVGEEAIYMHVLLSGSCIVVLDRSGHRRSIGSWRITGLLPYSRMTHYPAQCLIVDPAHVARIHRDHFQEMIYRIPLLGQRLVSQMVDRAREVVHVDEQAEKMIALGRLSAGLAHELNNPVSAVARSADALNDQVARLFEAACAMAGDRLPIVQIDRMLSAERHAVRSELERSDIEEQLACRLEECGIEDGWPIAAPLAEAGLSPGDLEELTQTLPPEILHPVLLWISARLSLKNLSTQLSDAASRIAGLVHSVARFAYMDRPTDRQPTSLQDGVEATLAMLAHTLTTHRIRIERVWPADLPPIEALPADLNQVWINLIENAVDAMPQGGTLRIEMDRRGDFLCVQIADTGTGIPPEIRPRIFEPFFTTKDVGAGAGMGLEIVDRIVRRRHGGEVTIDSRPGQTIVTVWLPMHPTH